GNRYPIAPLEKLMLINLYFTDPYEDWYCSRGLFFHNCLFRAAATCYDSAGGAAGTTNLRAVGNGLAGLLLVPYLDGLQEECGVYFPGMTSMIEIFLNAGIFPNGGQSISDRFERANRAMGIPPEPPAKFPRVGDCPRFCPMWLWKEWIKAHLDP